MRRSPVSPTPTDDTVLALREALNQLRGPLPPEPDPEPTNWQVLICVMGGFRILTTSGAVSLRAGGKVESLLSYLALRHDERVQREILLHLLWPDAEAALANQSLNSLTYNLQKHVGEALGGTPLVLHEGGSYRLNTAAGVSTDVVELDRLARAGEEQARLGDPDGAAAWYARAIVLYEGPITFGGGDARAVVERERVHVLYLRLLSCLAEHSLRHGDLAACLEYARRLLTGDPCREDGHRILMRCYARRGERAQAMRQYRLCEELLRREFEAVPEPATRELFDRIRSEPASV